MSVDPFVGVTGQIKTREVFINGKRLDPKRSQLLFNHSPDGFNWGYGGSGPAQLALAILLEYGVPDDRAEQAHQEFKWDVIAHLPSGDFQLPERAIKKWIKDKMALEI